MLFCLPTIQAISCFGHTKALDVQIVKDKMFCQLQKENFSKIFS